MTSLKLIVGLLFVVSISCGQSDSKIMNLTNSHSITLENQQPRYILFGVFCGECMGQCATMYRYNMMGNYNALLVDTTDSYFRNNGNVICKTQVSSIKKNQLVNNLVKQIPTRLLTSKKMEETFGCPDCTDGCGIYFEIGQNTTTKKNRIDYHTSELSSDIQIFGELIKTTLSELNKTN